MSYDPRWEQLYRIWSSDTSVRVYSTNEGDPASKADITVDGSLAASFDANGLSLANGVAVNEFSVDATLVGDSTSVVPTEYAVKTYVDNQFAQLTQDRIVDGDSSVVVIDDASDATSRINFNLDNSLFASLTSEGLKFDASDGTGNNVRAVSFSNDFSMGGYDALSPGDNGSQNYVPTEWAARRYVDDIHFEMAEPTGFVNTVDSQIGIDQTGSTYYVYVQPTSGTYTVFMQGQRWIKTTREEVVISDVEGLHYVYFDTDGVLKETTTFNINLLYTKGYVAVLYWDSTAKDISYFGEERHGITMDGKTHANIHLARGTTYISGLALSNLTPDSTGASDVDVQFSMSNGVITDEDITHSIAAQSFPANIQMWFLDGAANWREEAADAYPMINRGSGRVAYNLDTAGNWTQVEATDGYYVLTHVFATNDPTNQVIGIVGQAEYSSLESARIGASTEINALVAGDLPFAEFVPVATLIYQTSSSYTNTPQARLVSNDEGSAWTDWRTAGLSPVAGTATDHGSLSGLGNDDHLQYARTDGTRNITGLQTFLAGVTVSGGSLTLASGASVNEFSTDGTLGGDSDTAVPTEQAVKTYVDTEIQELRDELDLINIVETSSDTTATTGDVVLVDTTAGDVTITLQEHPDGKIMVKKVTTDTNSVIVTSLSGGLIDRLASRSFSTPQESYTYICDGTDFYVF